MARTLLDADSFSGWGIRTVSAAEKRYNPMGYHTGSVWPHDNALIAAGMARYGLVAEGLRVFEGIFDASMHFDMQRIPELFCGFSRGQGVGPVLYPVACSPQAWSAGAVFLMLQSCLGFRVSGSKPELSFVRPTLPVLVRELRILNFQVAGAEVDLLLTRHDHDVAVKVLRRQGGVEIMVRM